MQTTLRVAVAINPTAYSTGPIDSLINNVWDFESAKTTAEIMRVVQRCPSLHMLSGTDQSDAGREVAISVAFASIARKMADAYALWEEGGSEPGPLALRWFRPGYEVLPKSNNDAAFVATFIMPAIESASRWAETQIYRLFNGQKANEFGADLPKLEKTLCGFWEKVLSSKLTRATRYSPVTEVIELNKAFDAYESITQDVIYTIWEGAGLVTATTRDFKDDRVSLFASAKCHEGDVFDKKVGMKIATNRLQAMIDGKRPAVHVPAGMKIRFKIGDAVQELGTSEFFVSV